jgi:predicted RNA-binding protein YlxR (DUF448 family)
MHLAGRGIWVCLHVLQVQQALTVTRSDLEGSLKARELQEVAAAVTTSKLDLLQQQLTAVAAAQEEQAAALLEKVIWQHGIVMQRY